jgi:cytidylate kinase
MSNKLIIAVSGKSGCGNTTVSRIVAEKLRLRLINYTFHNYSEDLKIPFQELLARAARDSSYDLALDKKQLELARAGNCVLGSRLAIWLLKEANLKVYLDASPLTRAKRIAKRENTDVASVLQETEKRDANDRSRFLSLYNIDNNEFGFADLVIDTEHGDEYYVADRILSHVAKMKSI